MTCKRAVPALLDRLPWSGEVDREAVADFGLSLPPQQNLENNPMQSSLRPLIASEERAANPGSQPVRRHGIHNFW